MEVTFEQIASKMQKIALKQGFPIYAQFEITSRCNLKCKMCFVASAARDIKMEMSELTAAQLLDLAEQARDMGLMFINITGGEPLIKKDFWEFYDGLCRLGLIITLNTNGTTITPEVVERLAKTPPWRVLVTLYGASEKTYKKVTGSAKAFHLARKGVENLLDAGLNVLLRTTLIEDNFADYMTLSDWAGSLGHDLYIVNYVAPRREGAGTDPMEVRMKLEQVASIHRIMRHVVKERRRKSEEKEEQQVVEDKPLSEFLQQDERDLLSGGSLLAEELKDPREAFRCSAARNTFLLSHDGKMIPCGLLDEPVSYPLITGMVLAWEKLKSDCYDVPSCSACKECELQKNCQRCPAKLKLETGSFDKVKPDYLCGMAKVVNKINSEYQ